jgi:serine phosphatase RsbU (regulator of sigma subunit)
MTFPASTDVGWLHAESRHVPATQGIGGDIHDVMTTPFGIRLLIGDAMGVGRDANHTGLSVLNAWRALAVTEPSLAGVAIRLHGLIARSEDPERFVTALLMGFSGTGWAELICCGHPPPLQLRGGSAVFAEPDAAPPLGLMDLTDGWCRTSMIPLRDGDQLLLYTDGVSEARDPAGRFFPLAQFTAEILRTGQGGPRLLDALVARRNDHLCDRVPDDILLLLVTLGSGD